MKWQPIETAPRDGTSILAAWYDVDYWQIQVMHYEDFGGLNGGFIDFYEEMWSPTHWMPLPDPPEDT